MYLNRSHCDLVQWLETLGSEIQSLTEASLGPLCVAQMVCATVCIVAQSASSSAALRVSLASSNSALLRATNEADSRCFEFVWVRRLCALLWKFVALKGAASKDARAVSRVIKHSIARLMSRASLQDGSRHESQRVQNNLDDKVIPQLSRWCSWRDATFSLLENSGSEATPIYDGCINVIIELLWRWCATGILPFDDLNNFSHIFDISASMNIQSNQNTSGRVERDDTHLGNAIASLTSGSASPIEHDTCLYKPALADNMLDEDVINQSVPYVFDHIIEPHDLSTRLALAALKVCRNGAWMLSTSTSSGWNPSGKSLQRSLALAIGYSNVNLGQNQRTSDQVKEACMELLGALALEDACDVAAALSGMAHTAESEDSRGDNKKCLIAPIASYVSEWLSKHLCPSKMNGDNVLTTSRSPLFNLLEDRLVWESNNFTSLVEITLQAKCGLEMIRAPSLPVEESVPQPPPFLSRGASLLDSVVAARCNPFLPLPTLPPSTRPRSTNSSSNHLRSGGRQEAILDANLSNIQNDLEGVRTSPNTDDSLHLMSTQRLVATFLLGDVNNNSTLDSMQLSQWFIEPMRMSSPIVSAAAGAFLECLLQPSCVAILSEMQGKSTDLGRTADLFKSNEEDCVGNRATNANTLHRRRLRGLAFLAEATETGLDERIPDELVNLSQWVGSNLVSPPPVHEALSASDVVAPAVSTPRVLSTLALEGFLLRLIEAAATSSPSLNAAASQLVEAVAHAAAATEAADPNGATAFAFSMAEVGEGGAKTFHMEGARAAQRDLMQRLAPWLPASPALGALASTWLMQPQLFSAHASATNHFREQHNTWNEKRYSEGRRGSRRSVQSATPPPVAACLDFCAALRPAPHEWALRLFTVPALARAACPSLLAAALNGVGDESTDVSSSNGGIVSTGLLGKWRAAAEHLWRQSGNDVENSNGTWSVQQRDDVRKGLRQALPLLAGGALWLSVSAVTTGHATDTGTVGEIDTYSSDPEGEFSATCDTYSVQNDFEESWRTTSGRDNDHGNLSINARQRWQVFACAAWNPEGLLEECAGEAGYEDEGENESGNVSTAPVGENDLLNAPDSVEILLVVEEGTEGAWRSVGLKQRHGYFERYAAAAAAVVKASSSETTPAIADPMASSGGAAARSTDQYPCWQRVGPSYCSAIKCRSDDVVGSEEASSDENHHDLSPVSVLLGPRLASQPADAFGSVEILKARTARAAESPQRQTPRAAAALPLAPFLKAMLLAPSPSTSGAVHDVDAHEFGSPGRPPLPSSSAAGAGLRPWLLRLLDGFYCPVQFGGSSTALLAACLQVWLTTFSPCPSYAEAESHAAEAVRECLLSLAAAVEPDCFEVEDKGGSELPSDVAKDAPTLTEIREKGVQGLDLLQSLVTTAAAQAEGQLPLVESRWAALFAALPLRTLAACPPTLLLSLSSSLPSSQIWSSPPRSPAPALEGSSGVDESIMLWQSRGEKAVSLLVSLSSHLRALSLFSTKINPEEASWENESFSSSHNGQNGAGVGTMNNVDLDEDGNGAAAEAAALALADECLGPLAAAALAWADAALLCASPPLPPRCGVFNSRSPSASPVVPPRKCLLSATTQQSLKKFARTCVVAATTIATGENTCSINTSAENLPTSPHATFPTSPSTATMTSQEVSTLLPPNISPFEATMAARAWAAADSLARVHRFTAALRLWTAFATSRDNAVNISSSSISSSGSSRSISQSSRSSPGLNGIGAIARAAQDVTPRRRQILRLPSHGGEWHGGNSEMAEVQPLPELNAPSRTRAPPPPLPGTEDQTDYAFYHHEHEGSVYPGGAPPQGFEPPQSYDNAWLPPCQSQNDANAPWPEHPPPPMPSTHEGYMRTAAGYESRGVAEPQFTSYGVTALERPSFQSHEEQPSLPEPSAVQLPWQAHSPDASSNDRGQSLPVVRDNPVHNGHANGENHKEHDSSHGTQLRGGLNPSLNRAREDAAPDDGQLSSEKRPRAVKSDTKRAKAAAYNEEAPPNELPSPPKPKRVSSSSSAKKSGGHDSEGSSSHSSGRRSGSSASNTTTSSNGKRRQQESNKSQPVPLDFLQAISQKDNKRRRKESGKPHRR